MISRILHSERAPLNPKPSTLNKRTPKRGPLILLKLDLKVDWRLNNNSNKKNNKRGYKSLHLELSRC